MSIKKEVISWYKKKLKTEPNIENPVSYNDKIQWLKLYDQDPDQVICCDKILVKEYVSNIIGSKYIIPNSLEYPAVWKVNNGSGNVEFVNSSIDANRALKKIVPFLKKSYGTNKGEWAYRLIVPKVVKERRIDNGDVDYKFHCCNGEVKWVQMNWNRFSKNLKESIIDAQGNPMSLHLYQKAKHVEDPPHCGLEKFFELKDLAEKLSKKWKYVRVDLYYGENQPWFGELTFWPGSGCYLTPYLNEFGHLLNFDTTSTKPAILS